MPITPRNGDLLAGVASVYREDILASPNPLLTGDVPRLLATDELVGASKTIAALTVVGRGTGGALVPATYDMAAAATATGTLTFTGAGSAGETVTIGGRVYTLVSALTAANQVLIGANATATGENLAAAINGAAGAGTTYGTGTLPHPGVTATSAAGVVTLTAREPGAAANRIVTTETSAAASFGAGTLTGGADAAFTGVRPIGILVYAVETGSGDTTAHAPVYRAGCFNPDLLVWDASFDTLAKKRAGFEGTNAPTNIILRKPETMTV